MHKVIQYRRKCIGCAICRELQPDLWQMSRKDGKANLVGAVLRKDIHSVSSTASMHLLEQVEKSCPVNAIKIG